MARQHDRRLVASATALERCHDIGAYTLEDLGAHVLRGRASPVLVYAVAPDGR